MFCALSGTACENPVATPSGHIYESRLIRKHLQTEGTDPVTGQPLSEDDLITLKVTPSAAAQNGETNGVAPSSKLVTPRLTTHTSIPSLLSTLQSEWDSLMLETHSLKTQNLQLRQELSRSLYELDAAKRVVARLVRERDEAREGLRHVKAQFAAAAAAGGNAPSANGAAAMEVEQPQASKAGLLPQEAIDEMTQVSTALSKTRRKRKAPETYTSAEAVSSLAELPSLSLPSSAIFHHAQANKLVGVNKSQITLYDSQAKAEVASGSISGLARNEKPTAVSYAYKDDYSEFIAVGTSNGSVMVYQVQADKIVHSFTNSLSSAITAISTHPTQSYLLVTSTTNIAIISLSSQSSLATLDSSDPISTSSIHPDGLLFGVGVTTDTELQVRVYDIKQLEVVATFVHAPSSSTADVIKCIAFSENGYYVASSSTNSTVVKLWDLRKLNCAREIDAAEHIEGLKGEDDQSKGVGSVKFDDFGGFLAVEGAGVVCVYTIKPFAHIYTSPSLTASASPSSSSRRTKSKKAAQTDAGQQVTGVEWSSNGDSIFVGVFSEGKNNDSEVKVLGVSGNQGEGDAMQE
ncbi:WD40-repeat-containing domain protein [Paraphysoderma sedebokerense]|nr:WD40-repeat-containing domain protein [Paraphysoderma sedebokerense]